MNISKTVSPPVHGQSNAKVEGYDSLAELALDLRWSWNHATDEVWRQLDPALQRELSPRSGYTPWRSHRRIRNLKVWITYRWQ